MTSRSKTDFDTNLGTDLPSGTQYTMASLRTYIQQLLDSLGNVHDLPSGSVPIKASEDGVLSPSAIIQEVNRMYSYLPMAGPGQRCLDIGAFSVVSEGATISFFDRTTMRMYGAVSTESTPGAGVDRRATYFRPNDAFTVTDAVADTSTIISGTTHQFTIVNANLGTAREYRNITRQAGAVDITGANLIIRRNSHTDEPIFDYQRDVPGGNGFSLLGGASETTTTVDLGREYLFLAGETLYVTIEGDGTTPLNLLGQSILGSVVPHVDVYGRLGVIQRLEDDLGTPSADGYLLASDMDGTRSWIDPDTVGGGGSTLPIALSDTTNSNTNQFGLLAAATTGQQALDLIDNSGQGSPPTTFTPSFFASSSNSNIWYGNVAAGTLQSLRTHPNGNYTFRLPDFSDMDDIFDALQARGLPEVYTRTIDYISGTTTSVVRNSLTIRPASVSHGFDPAIFPITISQGTSVTLRISRAGSRWEVVNLQQASDPVATFGEFVFQSTGWNNADGSFLPSGMMVQKGYAFPVVGSNPNDGTLRAGLEASVGDRVIRDGDYVVWTADTFTSWTDGDNWFVINRSSLQRISREQSNFLSQTSEIDNRVDLADVNLLGGDAVVWLSENPLQAAPFITPSTDPNNPRSGDDYRYIGGREDRDSVTQRFQFGQNRFNSYITVGVSPSFIAGHPESDIDVVLFDDSGNEVTRLNLATDFTFRDDGDFTNSTYRHYTGITTFNYPFLGQIAVILTQEQRHFRINPQTVNVTQNIPADAVTEPQLSPAVRTKLNAPAQASAPNFDAIRPQISPLTTFTSESAATDARFLSTSTTDPYPSGLSGFTQVAGDNPRFQATDVILFVAVPEPGNFVLLNTTTDTPLALDDSEATVEVIESLSVDGVTYFVYRVTGITSGNRFEVRRTQLHTEALWQHRLDLQQEQIDRNTARSEHALLNLDDNVVGVFENEVSVTEQTTPTIVATDYNRSLSPGNSQSVFMEPVPGATGTGFVNSAAINQTAGSDRYRQKLLYFPEGMDYGNAVTVSAFDGGTNNRDLIRYVNGTFNARVFVPGSPAGMSTETIYPTTSTSVSGPGIWQTIAALTFINGVPVPEADEIFFTRNIPTSATTLTIQYRGHANGNVFGQNTTTLSNVGGSTDAITTFVLNDGSETVNVEVRYTASTRTIRVSETARVNTGLPTINDIQVILSYTETRTIPATNNSTRDVAIETISHDGRGQVFGFKPSSTGTLIIVGDRLEVDTGFSYTNLFGTNETGHLVGFSDGAVFYDYEGFEPINTTILDLEQRTNLAQNGLFTTEYNHLTTLDIDTAMTVRNDQGDIVRVGQEIIAVSPNGTRYRVSVDNSGNLTTTQVT